MQIRTTNHHKIHQKHHNYTQNTPQYTQHTTKHTPQNTSLQDYRCSLKDWRNRHARGCTRDTLPLYLAVFQQALQATAVCVLVGWGCIGRVCVYWWVEVFVGIHRLYVHVYVVYTYLSISNIPHTPYTPTTPTPSHSQQQTWFTMTSKPTTSSYNPMLMLGRMRCGCHTHLDHPLTWCWLILGSRGDFTLMKNLLPGGIGGQSVSRALRCFKLPMLIKRWV